MFKTDTDRLETYKRMFATDDGKQVLEDLKERFHIETMTFVDNNRDLSFVHEGQRSVVLYVLHLLKEEKQNQQTIAEG
tara:strand:+ start:1427 stop:1660 length:234 start_codon:yes stop_codon:yes gene_type:complete